MTGGAFASGVATADAGSNIAGTPAQSTPPVIGGAYAGCGAGIFMTNAGNIQALSGPFLTLNVSFGWEGALSFQLEFSGNIWFFTGTVGSGLGASVSGTTTNTITTGKRR